MTKVVAILGGTSFEQDVARKTVAWSIKRLGLGRLRILKVYVSIKTVIGDYTGCCEEGDSKRSYIITISDDQGLRDFVMTVIHEMIHVKQYVRNKWVGDGEAEAERLQELLTDELWKENIL